jgi:hypothetical protein
MGSSKISLKLLIDYKAKKVLFAEAGKEFVDFVFSLLTLPIGAVAKLVSAGTMHGSVGRLYESVDRMGASYLQPGTDRSDLLQPKVLHPDAGELLLLRGLGGGRRRGRRRVRQGGCHVHGDRRARGHAHVGHLQHHAHQQVLRRQGRGVRRDVRQRRHARGSLFVDWIARPPLQLEN